ILPGGVDDLDEVARSLWSGSDGMPLAIWASLQTWLDRGYLTHSVEDGVGRLRGSDEGTGNEPGIRPLVSPRPAAASQRVREFSLHAAVLGMEISSDEIQYLCEMLDANADDLIADVVGLGVLIRSRGGLRSPHSSIREFVLASFTDAERRAAHDRIAKMLVE